MTRMLSRVPMSDWVLRTAQAMDDARGADDAAWRKHWADSYWALGGTSDSVAHKGCPRTAAYGLWYLEWLKGSSRPLLDWPVQRVRDGLGKNAAYAAIAARLLARAGVAQSHGTLWTRVRQQFQRDTGEKASNSDQGAVRLALLLFLRGMLAVPPVSASDSPGHGRICNGTAELRADSRHSHTA